MIYVMNKCEKGVYISERGGTLLCADKDAQWDKPVRLLDSETGEVMVVGRSDAAKLACNYSYNYNPLGGYQEVLHPIADIIICKVMDLVIVPSQGYLYWMGYCYPYPRAVMLYFYIDGDTLYSNYYKFRRGFAFHGTLSNSYGKKMDINTFLRSISMELVY